MLRFPYRLGYESKKKAGVVPAMPSRQSSEQWVGGDLFTRHFNYRRKP